MDALTIEQFKQALPDKVKKTFNQEVAQHIIDTLSDPDMYETYRDNLISYTSIMSDGKFKMTSYINAVKYVSHKLMGKTNNDAFHAVFPLKAQEWATKNFPVKDQSSYITSYGKTKLVTLIMEQTLIPSWVLNQDLYQKALNVQADLMMTANSEKVRTDAANSILTHLKMPETQKVELQVAVKKDSVVDALREATSKLVEQQRAQIATGVSTAGDMAVAKIIIGESERIYE